MSPLQTRSGWVKVRFLSDYKDPGSGFCWHGAIEYVKKALADQMVEKGVATIYEHREGDMLYLIQLEKVIREGDARMLAVDMGADLSTDDVKWTAAALSCVDELNNDRTCTGTVYEQAEDGQTWLPVATFRMDYNRSDDPKVWLTPICCRCRSTAVLQNAIKRVVACESCGWNIYAYIGFNGTRPDSI